MGHYVPELHDAHPGSVETIARILEALPDEDRAACAILVVPIWAHAGPCHESGPFVDWLRRQPGETVLHGYAHTAPQTAWNHYWYGTANEAEFARLDLPAARALVEAGAAILERATGRRPRWFCAPRWQQSSAVAQALVEAGFAGWMRRGHLRLAGGRRLNLPAVWFDDGERVWRRAGAGMVRRFRIRRLLDGERPFRLAFHPRDMQEPGSWQEARGVVDTLRSRGWTPVSLSQAAGLEQRAGGTRHAEEAS
jgi:predicted deacetylase